MATNFLLTSLFVFFAEIFLPPSCFELILLPKSFASIDLSHTTNFSISCCSFNFHVKQSLSGASHCHVNDTFQTGGLCITARPGLRPHRLRLSPGPASHSTARPGSSFCSLCFSPDGPDVAKDFLTSVTWTPCLQPRSGSQGPFPRHETIMNLKCLCPTSPGSQDSLLHSLDLLRPSCF